MKDCSMDTWEIIGQEKLNRATMIFYVSDNLNTFLISGKSGTGKSKFVKSLEKKFDRKIHLLPIGATDDMIFGGISPSIYIKDKVRYFEKGIIERSDKGILFLDEINLFSEQLVKEILDSIEYKRILVNENNNSNIKKISTKLVGVMNPEEGFMSPTALEKFSIYIEMENIKDPELRKEIIRQELSSNKNGLENEEIISLLKDAKERLGHIRTSDNAIKLANEICVMANVEGYRALFDLIEGARAICALDNIREIGHKQLLESMEYTILHRKNEKEDNEFEPQNNEKEDSKDEERENEENENNEENEENEINEYIKDLSQEKDDSDANSKTGSTEEENPILPNQIYSVKNLFEKRMDRKKRKGSGKRSKVISSKKRGRIVSTKFARDCEEDINFLRSIVSGVLDGAYDFETKTLKLENRHLRQNIRRRRIGASIVFLVDSSASMNARKRMLETKNAILSILMDSYIKRDEIAMICFANGRSDILMPFTRSVLLAKRELEEIVTKGRTPLSEGLYRALELIRAKKKKEKDSIPILVLITDGRANEGNIFKENPLEDAKYVAELIKEEDIISVVIDTENSFIKLGIPKEISESLGGRYYKLSDIKSEKIATIVKNTADYSISRIEIMED